MGTLNKEHIVAPHTFQENGANFTITEFLNIDPAQLAAVSLTNVLG
jgi:hypothetical protein